MTRISSCIRLIHRLLAGNGNPAKSKGEEAVTEKPSPELNSELEKLTMESVLNDVTIGDMIAHDLENENDFNYPLTVGGHAYTVDIHPELIAQSLATAKAVEEATLKRVGEWLEDWDFNPDFILLRQFINSLKQGKLIS